MNLSRIIQSPLLYPLWRIAWLERAFFRLCRWLDKPTQELFNLNDKGYDCSYYQGIIDFQKMKAYGAKFVILRLGYAVFADTKFVEYMAGVAGVLPFEVYHYYDPIYSPIEQANRVISILAPYKSKIRRVWLDFEFGWAGNFSASNHWLTYLNAIRAAGYNVGIYTRATWWDSRVGTYAAEFGKYPLWAAQYNTALTLIPKGWTKAMIWQKGTPSEGIAAGVSSQEIDLDIWNNDFDFATEWGTSPTVLTDVISYPYDGMKRVSGERNGWQFELFVLDPAKFDFELVSTPGLETVPSVARRKGAILATTAGEWVRETLKPQDYTVSNGETIVTRDKLAARPSLLIKSDDLPKITHINEPNVQQAFTGLRYLVGPLADPSKWNTEGHARACFGVNIDGHVITLVSEGVYPNQGLTLLQCAELLKSYRAVVAFDGGGGGDASCVLDQQALIIPENINPDTGAHFHRALPMTFCVYAKDVTMATRYEATAIVDGTRLRPDHNTDNVYLASYPAGTKFHGDAVYIVPTNTATQYAGDTWLQVTDVNGTAKAGWVAIVHRGVRICNIVDGGIVTPPPVTDSVTIDITLHDVKVTGDAYEAKGVKAVKVA